MEKIIPLKYLHLKEKLKIIDEICSVKLPMRLHWHRSMQSQSAVLYFISKLKNYLGFDHYPILVRIPNNLIDAQNCITNYFS